MRNLNSIDVIFMLFMMAGVIAGYWGYLQGKKPVVITAHKPYAELRMNTENEINQAARERNHAN